MSQNVALSRQDLIDIERIKPMILERKTQIQMAIELKRNRRTIQRKIYKWCQTKDFRLWLTTAWIDKLSKVSDTEAFRGLTKLMQEYLAKEVLVPTPKAFRWLTEEEWSKLLQSDIDHIQGKKYFIAAQRDSDVSHVVDDGEKPVAAQTSSSS